ncbi:hypothetical protein Tco_1266833 [Tanacetum coccineum]
MEVRTTSHRGFCYQASKTSKAMDTMGDRFDRLTKSAIFTPMRETDPLDKLARLTLWVHLDMNTSITSTNRRAKQEDIPNSSEDIVVSPVCWTEVGEKKIKYSVQKLIQETLRKSSRSSKGLQAAVIDRRVTADLNVLAARPFVPSLDGPHLMTKLHFVEEPLEIVDRD